MYRSLPSGRSASVFPFKDSTSLGFRFRSLRASSTLFAMNLRNSINILSFYIVVFFVTSYSSAKSINDTTATDANRVKRIDIAKSKNSNRQRTTTEAVTFSTTTSAVPPDSEVVTYRLEGPGGVPCILIRTDALVEFKYKNAYGEQEASDLYVPDAYTATGDCDSSDDVYIEISWKGYTWSIYFSKTPGGEHWYIGKMELELDSYGIDKSFKHWTNPPKKLIFSTPKDKAAMLFPTPVGKAYTCAEEISVPLSNPIADALVLFRSTKMQPFIFKKDDFGPEYICSPGGIKSFRDETAPIAVGSTFAIVTLLTVTGYGVYRYMKIKKVQYDTME